MYSIFKVSFTTNCKFNDKRRKRLRIPHDDVRTKRCMHGIYEKEKEQKSKVDQRTVKIHEINRFMQS